MKYTFQFAKKKSMEIRQLAISPNVIAELAFCNKYTSCVHAVHVQFQRIRVKHIRNCELCGGVKTTYSLQPKKERKNELMEAAATRFISVIAFVFAKTPMNRNNGNLRIMHINTQIGSHMCVWLYVYVCVCIIRLLFKYLSQILERETCFFTSCQLPQRRFG